MRCLNEVLGVGDEVWIFIGSVAEYNNSDFHENATFFKVFINYSLLCVIKAVRGHESEGGRGLRLGGRSPRTIFIF